MEVKRQAGPEGEKEGIPLPGSLEPEVERAAFLRAQGRCECRDMACRKHGRNSATMTGGDVRCSRTFFFPERGEKWAAFLVDPSGPHVAENCRILCLPCAGSQGKTQAGKEP